MATPLVNGTAREVIAPDALDALRRANAVVIDDRRRRPRYFDGRFLAARDLTRDQAYVLTRQADLGTAIGVGVVSGLVVGFDPAAPTRLTVSAGLGLAPGGEAVELVRALTIDLTDLAAAQALDAALGLSRLPVEPARARTGLFVLALRAVEFTANPVASFPTTVDGRRTVEDGDVVEATALTLVPYPDAGPRDDPGLRRSRVAHDLFVRRGPVGPATAALPLAMVALDRGTVQWVDADLVRRELTPRSDLTPGLGFAPRALREAHVRQYDAQLDEVLAQRRRDGRPPRFAAVDHFFALPAVGRLPSASVDPEDFSQIYFPPSVDVDLTVVPDDELPSLLQESLDSDPIDLTAAAADLDSSSVLVVIPVPRAALAQIRAGLATVTLPQPLRSKAPGLIAARTPIESILRLRLPSPAFSLPAPVPVADTVWRRALAGRDVLWYLRRRHLPSKVEAAGVPVSLAGDLFRDEADVVARLTGDVGLAAFDSVKAKAKGVAPAAAMTRALASPRFARAKAITGGIIEEWGGLAALDEPSIRGVVDRFSDPDLGDGLDRLTAAVLEFSSPEVLKGLIVTQLVPEIDAAGRRAAPDRVAALGNDLVPLLKAGDKAEVQKRLAAEPSAGGVNP